MRASTYLRTAAVICVFYGGGHTAGVPWTPALGPHEQPVIDAMKAVHFDAMGSSRSYWDFYVGFGLSLGLLVLVLAVLLWQCANLARSDTRKLRPLLLTLLIGFVLITAILAKYFFALPVLCAAAIAVCLALALISSRASA